MADILVTHATVITMDPRRRVLEDGAIAVEGDRIVAVGRTADVRRTHGRARKVIDGRGKVAMPGLIDNYGNSGTALAKNIGERISGYAWRLLMDHILFRSVTAEYWHVDGQLGALERLKFGTTCFLNMFGTAPRGDDPDYPAAHIRGIAEVGLRSVTGVGPSRPPYPTRYSSWTGARRTDRLVSMADSFKVAERVIRRHHGTNGGRTNVWVAISRINAPSKLDPMFQPRFVKYARQQAKIIKRLLAEYEVGLRSNAFGGAVSWAHRELGLLGPRVVLAHCTGLSPSEIEIFASTGTRVAHCPSSGRYADDHAPCPVPQLLEAGAIVAIATDGTNSSSFDLFKDLRRATYIQRYEQQNRYVLPPGRALKMATIDAARAIGRADDLGSLEVGKKADLVMLDLWKAHLQPINMLVEQIVAKAMGSDVATVVCDGKVVLERGRATLVDEDEVLARAVEESGLMRDRAGVEPLLGQAAGFWDCSRY